MLPENMAHKQCDALTGSIDEYDAQAMIVAHVMPCLGSGRKIHTCTSRPSPMPSPLPVPLPKTAKYSSEWPICCSCLPLLTCSSVAQDEHAKQYQKSCLCLASKTSRGQRPVVLGHPPPCHVGPGPAWTNRGNGLGVEKQNPVGPRACSLCLVGA
jgi:hypothetical protein